MINASFLSSRSKRIESLKKQYQERKSQKDETSLLLLDAMTKFTDLMLAICAMLSVMGLLALFMIIWLYEPTSRIIFVVFAGLFTFIICTGLSFITLASLRNNIDNWSNFAKYEKKTIDKIQNLGGNPEDLDREVVKE